MNTPDASRYVVVVRPHILQDRDGSWRAQYPETDWSVLGDSEQDARARLHDEFERRLQSGRTDTAPNEDLLERHLATRSQGCMRSIETPTWQSGVDPDFDAEINRLIEVIG